MRLIKLPGLIDCHVHLRDPGATHKEDFTTGTMAAIAGGITTVIDMPNNPIPTTTLEQLREKIKLAKKKALCSIFFYFGATKDNYEQFSKVKDKVKGLKFFMDHYSGPLLIQDLKIIKKIFQAWPGKIPILVHAEGYSIKKAINLIKFYNKPIHFCHVSQASEIEMIKKAKQEGLPVTCEVTLSHLFLAKEDIKHLGAFALVRPPLRPKKDVQALWKNLALIDCFATDHAPHTIEEKKSDNPPNGVPGLETALPLLLDAVNRGQLTIDDIILRYFKNPSKIFKINQDKETYIEIDLDKKWEIKNESLFTKCGWSPFNGWQVQGKVLRTFVKGRKVFEDDKVLIGSLHPRGGGIKDQNKLYCR